MNDSNVDKYIEVGCNDMNWYAECQQVFEEIFGPQRLHLVCKLFAATSINTSLKANVYLFRKALYEIENDLPIGSYLPNIQSQLAKIRAGEDLSGRKIRSFAAAMSGDLNAVVVDVWLLRAFEMDRKYFRQNKGQQKGRGKLRSSGASNKQYTLIENWVRNRADVTGLEPRQLSSMIWAGVRIAHTGDRETHYKNLLRYHFNNLFNVI